MAPAAVASTNKPATLPGPVSLSEPALPALAEAWPGLDGVVLGDFGVAAGERCWEVAGGLGAGGVFDLDDIIMKPLSTTTIAK